MSRAYISSELRKRVAERSDETCEYCLIPLLYGFFTPYQIDHIISEKHGGDTTLENLALACKSCNSLKGSDIATYLKEQKITVRLFHPRNDDWQDHFDLSTEGQLIPRSDIAEATIQLLVLNDDSYVKLRRVLLAGKIKLVGPRR